MKKIILQFLFLISLFSTSSGAATLTFNGLSGSSGSNLHRIEALTIDGYDFSYNPQADMKTGYGYIIGTDYSDADTRTNAYNSTDMLLGGYAFASVNMSTSSGSSFSLVQFDATEYFSNVLTEISVSAVTTGGINISQSFFTDSIANDETGPHQDFQTFVLSDEFLSVTSVTFSFDNNGWSALDNIVVSQVPLPAAVWLFGSALAGLGWLRRKQTAQI